VAFSSALELQLLLFGHRNFLAAFPTVPRVFYALTHTDHDIWHLLLGTYVFLQDVQFRILPCAVDHISFADREEEKPVTT